MTALILVFVAVVSYCSGVYFGMAKSQMKMKRLQKELKETKSELLLTQNALAEEISPGPIHVGVEQ